MSADIRAIHLPRDPNHEFVRVMAQATTQLAVSPKSDSIGQAYAAAMKDVLEHGALRVPKHLRSATGRQRLDTGDGRGYENPHDFEGDDVPQQYLPDALVGRRYYRPGNQGSEARISEIMADRELRRQKPKRKPIRPRSDPMGSFGAGMKAHTESRTRLAETQKRDAKA